MSGETSSTTDAEETDSGVTDSETDTGETDAADQPFDGLRFVAAAVSLEFVLGFVLALLLFHFVQRRRLVLTLLLVPMMLAPVAVGLIWKLLLQGDFGMVTYYLRQVGGGIDNLNHRFSGADVSILVEIEIHDVLAVTLDHSAGHGEENNILISDDFPHLVPVAAFHDDNPICYGLKFRHATFAGRGNRYRVALSLEIACGGEACIGRTNNCDLH